MFIRTKDGIYELKKVEILCGVKFYDYETREDFVNRIREKHIINQSDTIEELCDEFVFVLNHSKIGQENEYIMIKKSNLEYFKLLGEDIKNSILYGAIWTDKGLIYVVKMNDKREFELI